MWYVDYARVLKWRAANKGAQARGVIILVTVVE